MITRNILCSATLALACSFTSFNAAANNHPPCSSAAADPDGDGFGWENNTTCIVGDSASAPQTQSSGGACVDSPPFDDNWGWDGTQSCLLNSDTNSGGGSTPSTDSGATGECVDTAPFNDNWGWDGTQSCLLNSDADSGSGGTLSTDSGSSGECVDTAPFDDNWGWDGTQSCQLSASAQPTAPSSDESCVDTGVIGDGWGWNGVESCLVDDSSTNSTPVTTPDTGSGTPDTDTTPTTPARPPVITPPAVASSGTSTFIPLGPVPTDACLTRQDALNGTYHDVIRSGDFILSTNAWNASAAGGFDWEQCIYANQNGAKAGWSYHWGAGGGSNDYNVRSYPELIYGVKSQGEISAPKSTTGLPMRIDSMPEVSIRYSFATEEFGPIRAVDASVNPRFPNGTLISGERNVAVESFLHPSDSNGQCPASVVQRGSGFSNHTYEIMVWLDSGAERLPSGPGDFVTNVSISGQPYDVYTKSSDLKYVAFVATNPQQIGTINWTAFVRWAQTNAHRVRELYGARTNSVAIQGNWCMANILVGTEIWWGDGYFDILDWQISR